MIIIIIISFAGCIMTDEEIFKTRSVLVFHVEMKIVALRFFCFGLASAKFLL
jgi:hypothetical protein